MVFLGWVDRTWIQLTSAGVAILVYSGCTNNLNLNGNLTVNLNSNGSTPVGYTGGDGTGSFTLSRIIKNTLNPEQLIDLIGDGSGTFGDICQTDPNATSTGTTSSTSTTVCECAFDYTQSDGTTLRVFSPVSYHETNLLRCVYNSVVPSTVSTFTVYVHLTSADTYSNGIAFTPSGTGTTLDVTNPDTFAKVFRYQCRDSVYIPYLFDPSTIYDPIQSENPHIAFPLNFYTVNLGGAIQTYVNSAQSNADNIWWNCPPILDPADNLTSTTMLNSYYSYHHLNMNIYSINPLDGSKLIYPPSAGSFDRSSFYVAKQKVGIFTIPVNAYLAPNVVSTDGSAYPPLGYGASPIATATSGQELCPDTSTTIPAGYHWVKLWLFRASLLPRKFVTYGTSGGSGSSGLTSSMAFVCSPGDWPNNTGNPAQTGPIFSSCPSAAASCAATNGAYTDSCTLGNVDTTNFLADRVFGIGSTSMCLRMKDRGAVSCASNSAGPGCGSFAEDYVRLLNPYNNAWGGTACDPNSLQDPFNLCGNNTVKIPLVGSSSFSLQNIDSDSGRYDYVYVVSPPSVTLKAMQDTNPQTSSSLAYQPYRFKSDQDCNSSDPDQPSTSGDCSIENKINYGLKLHDVSESEDPSGDSSNRAGTFPICVLQKDS